jgi:hypothetical protein
VDWIKLAHCYLILESGNVDWIKLAHCYVILGNRGVWTGLNWLTVT